MLVVLVVGLAGLGFGVWWGESRGSEAPTIALASYVSHAVGKGAYFKPVKGSPSCDAALQADGTNTGIEVCNRSTIGAIVTPANEPIIGRVVTDLAGSKQWKKAQPWLGTPNPYTSSWATTIIGSSVEVTLSYYLPTNTGGGSPYFTIVVHR
jgi:hypothetical protein